MKENERKKSESRPKERREVGENEWWGVGLGGRHVGTKKSDLTPPPPFLSLSLSDDRDVTASQLIIA